MVTAFSVLSGPFRCPQQRLSRSENYSFFIAFRGVKLKWMYLLREMSGHKAKKNTLYFDVRHTVYLFAIDVYYYRLYVVVKAILIRIVDISTALKISLFLQTRDHTAGR